MTVTLSPDTFKDQSCPSFFSSGDWSFALERGLSDIPRNPEEPQGYYEMQINPFSE